jgi:hypothetical protein
MDYQLGRSVEVLSGVVEALTNDEMVNQWQLLAMLKVIDFSDEHCRAHPIVYHAVAVADDDLLLALELCDGDFSAVVVLA